MINIQSFLEYSIIFPFWFYFWKPSKLQNLPLIFNSYFSYNFIATRTAGVTGAGLALSPDDTQLFFYALTKTGSKSAFWKLLLTSTSFSWMTLPFQNIDYFTPFLSLNRALIGGALPTPDTALNILFDWGQTIPVWSLRQNCPTGSTWGLRSSATLEVGNILYFAWAINSNLNFLFSGHYTANATAVGNKYLASTVVIERITDMTLVNGIIYIAGFQTSANCLLFSYNPTTDTWGQTYSLPTTYTTFFTLGDPNL